MTFSLTFTEVCSIPIVLNCFL